MLVALIQLVLVALIQWIPEGARVEEGDDIEHDGDVVQVVCRPRKASGLCPPPHGLGATRCKVAAHAKFVVFSSRWLKGGRWWGGGKVISLTPDLAFTPTFAFALT